MQPATLPYSLANLDSCHVVITLLVILTGIALYPQTQAKFKLYFQNNDKNRKFIEKCPSIKQGYFFPTPYLASGILQAWFSSIYRYKGPALTFKDEYVAIPGNGSIHLHWATHKDREEISKLEKESLLIVIPGLTATSMNHYIRNLTTTALDQGYKVVVYHPRGLTGHGPHFPDEGFIDPVADLKHTIDIIKKRNPNTVLYGVGHSYGANILVKYLGKHHNETPLIGACSISNPWDMKYSSRKLHGTMYDKFLAKHFRQMISKNPSGWRSAPKHMNLDVDGALNCQSIREFDDCITKKMFGYEDVDEARYSLSCIHEIQKISIPLFCMNAKDDPVLLYDGVPVKDIMSNPNIIMMATYNGGHTAWFNGFLKPRRWYPTPTLEFLKAVSECLN